MIDVPGGGGKVPINPGYTLYHDAEKIVIRNYEGKVFEYPEDGENSVSTEAEPFAAPDPHEYIYS